MISIIGFLNLEPIAPTVVLETLMLLAPSLNIVKIPKQPTNPFIFLPMKLHNKRMANPTTVTALIDSGAQENFVNENYAPRFSLQRHRLEEPITLRYADGSTN